MAEGSPAARPARRLSPTRSWRHCMKHHGYRHFWNRAQRARYLPPLLWTFPGAGNTWLRMLLDFSTGVYTGSIYGDMSLLPLLPGEGRCDRSVVALKAHPMHIDSNDFVEMPDGLLGLNVTRKLQYLKCSSFRFDSAVAVVRDPYAAIFAEYKRYTNWREVVGNRHSDSAECQAALRKQSIHSGAMLRACFNSQHFYSKARSLARSWKHMWFHYGRFEKISGTRMLHINYESLLDEETRLATLRRLLQLARPERLVLVLPSQFNVDSSLSHTQLPCAYVTFEVHVNGCTLCRIVDFLRLYPNPTDEALRCAVRLADNPHIHRNHSKEQNDLFVSSKHAYDNRTFVCELWKFVGRTASRAGYVPFGGISC